MVYVCKGDGIRNADTAFVLFFEYDVWRLFVDPNTKTFQFRLDDFLVGEWFIDIQYNKD